MANGKRTRVSSGQPISSERLTGQTTLARKGRPTAVGAAAGHRLGSGCSSSNAAEAKKTSVGKSTWNPRKAHHTSTHNS